MGVAKFEVTPFWKTIALPAIIRFGEGVNIFPTKLFFWPAERLGHRLPHGDDDRATDEVIRLTNDEIGAISCAPLIVGDGDIN